MHPLRTGKRRPDLSAAFGGAFELGQPLSRRCDVIGLQMRPPKDATPRTETQL